MPCLRSAGLFNCNSFHRGTRENCHEISLWMKSREGREGVAVQATTRFSISKLFVGSSQCKQCFASRYCTPPERFPAFPAFFPKALLVFFLTSSSVKAVQMNCTELTR